jgi:prefoldin subunit 5
LKNQINKLSQENEELKNKIKEIKERLATVLQLI